MLDNNIPVLKHYVFIFFKTHHLPFAKILYMWAATVVKNIFFKLFIGTKLCKFTKKN